MAGVSDFKFPIFLQFVRVAILAAVGVLCWYYGDRPGDGYNGWAVLAGWLFMFLAYALYPTKNAQQATQHDRVEPLVEESGTTQIENGKGQNSPQAVLELDLTQANEEPKLERVISARKAREKAQSFIRESHIDQNLIKVYEDVRHYGSWSTREDFNSTWNIGVTDITSEKRKEKISYFDIEREYLSFKVDGRKITLAFGDHFYSTPDGSETETVITYLVDDEILLTARFAREYGEYVTTLRLWSVEEFHNKSSELALLKRLRDMGGQLRRRQDQERRNEENKEYEGKFSF